MANGSRLLRVLQEIAAEKGYSVGVAPAEPSPTGAKLTEWLGRDMHASMAWMAKEPERRIEPAKKVAGAKSEIAFSTSYRSDEPPPDSILREQLRGRVARYAWNRDYHDVLTSEIREIVSQASEGAANRAWVDTGPVLERDVAVRAGLGFASKNTNLIRPGEGSFLFLGAGITAAELPPTPSNERPGCGECRICLDQCPTKAIVAPNVVDARLCISYWTIEHRGPIPREMRPKLGAWVFGCDVCQDVCPWNASPKPAAREELRPRSVEDMAPSLTDLLALDAAAFRTRYRGTPIERTKRRGLLRNAAIALGNHADPRAIPALRAALTDEEPLVRGHAAWALGEILHATGDIAARAALETTYRHETDEWAGSELDAALTRR